MRRALPWVGLGVGVVLLVLGIALRDALGMIGDLYVGVLVSSFATVPIGLSTKALADRRRRRRSAMRPSSIQ